MSDNPIDEGVRAQAAEWFAEYDKHNHFPYMLALDAYAAGHAAAQKQGQVVAVELTVCCGREECGGECGNPWRGMEWVRKQLDPESECDDEAKS